MKNCLVKLFSKTFSVLLSFGIISQQLGKKFQDSESNKYWNLKLVWSYVSDENAVKILHGSAGSRLFSADIEKKTQINCEKKNYEVRTTWTSEHQQSHLNPRKILPLLCSLWLCKVLSQLSSFVAVTLKRVLF